MSNKNLEELHSKIDGSSSRQYITSRGIEVTLRPLPPYLVQMSSANLNIPEPPTYEVEIAGGGVEIHKHDAESIGQSSEEDKAKWNEYSQKVIAENAKASENLVTIILIDGVQVDIPDENRWIKKMSLMGVTVPDDPEDRLLMYKKTEVLGTTEDMENITSIVLSLTGVSKEDLDSIKKSFRR